MRREVIRLLNHLDGKNRNGSINRLYLIRQFELNSEFGLELVLFGFGRRGPSYLRYHLLLTVHQAEFQKFITLV